MFGFPARPDTTSQQHVESRRRERHPDRAASARETNPSTVIVVGSTTTALLVEALAIAGMFPAGSLAHDPAAQSPTIRRASSWTSAATISGGLPSCIVIALEENVVDAPRLVDRHGRSVDVLVAEAVLSRCRDRRPYSLASRTIGDRIRRGVEAALAPADHFLHGLTSLTPRRAPGVGTRSSS